jgi:DNA-binding XRE family transcriptional regulator
MTRLRQARRYVRLSQTAVANFIGTTRQSVAAFEKGTRSPDLKHLVKAANLLRLTLNDMVAERPVARRVGGGPAFRPRLNRPGQLTSADDEELRRFERYLQTRSRLGAAPTFTSKGPRTIADAIDQLYTLTDVSHSAPVPVFGLLAKCGVEIRFTALEQLAGALVISPDAARRPPGVLINSDQPPDRQRFSGAHELGHLVLAHDPEGDAFIDLLGRHFFPMEVQADQFASELLMPVDLIRARHRDLAKEPAPHAVLRLARAFLVSFQAMGTRLTNLGLLTPSEIDLVRKAKPGEVATAIGPTPSLGKLVRFNAKNIRGIANTYLAPGWSKKMGPDDVRLLQETAYSHYLGGISEGAASDSAGHVYETVARWVAENCPLVDGR